MRKISFLVMAMGVLLSGCLPASLQSDTSGPTPLSEQELQATAAVLSQQTLQALPSPTIMPSNTPVIITATGTNLPSETSTQTAASSTESVTLPSATETVTAALATPVTVTTSLSSTVTSTPRTGFTATTTETLHPRFYGTLPPNLPSGQITLVNKSKKEVYISLQCTTQDGFITIIEYPVPSTVKTNAPAGKYIYVAWVGGNKITGNFGLGKRDEIVITIYKDRIGIK
jgi:hypothetical protein